MMQNTTDLFYQDDIVDATIITSVHDAVAQAIDTLRALIASGRYLAVSYSGGKDSSCIAALALAAAKAEAARAGQRVRVAICHADTLSENPAVALLARNEMQKMQIYSESHGIDLDIRVATPRISENYFLNILSGRTIANLPEGGAKCSMDLKVRPITRLKRTMAADYGSQLVTVLGTRLDESSHRRRAMEGRGESASVPVINTQGDAIISPIMNWSLDNVFEFLAYAGAGEFDAYSDFRDLFDIYRDANAGTCELVAYSDGKAPKTGCGARTGCFHCQRAPRENESLENMLTEPKYSYMSGLASLRRYIRATHYDPSKRNWIGRRIHPNGDITISPVAYSPQHCRDLIAFCLTIDAEEQQAASELGIDPRFQILPPAHVVAIDFQQSRYGYSDAMTACRLYDEIHNRGARYHVPVDTPVYPKTPFPEAVTVKFSDTQYDNLAYGFRDIEAACAGAENLTLKADGKYYAGGDGGECFSVDEEGAELFMAFELDRALNQYKGDDVFPSAVMHYFLRLGTVEIYRGSHKETERALRISNQIHRLGLRGLLSDREALIERLGTEGSLGNADAFELVPG